MSGRNGFFNDDSEPSIKDDGDIVGTTGDDGLMSCSMLYDDGEIRACLEKICSFVCARTALKTPPRSICEWPVTACSLAEPSWETKSLRGKKIDSGGLIEGLSANQDLAAKKIVAVSMIKSRPTQSLGCLRNDFKR